MKRRKVYLYCGGFALLIFSSWILSIEQNPQADEDFSEIVKISLRNVGNQLLLSDLDSTSLVLPIIELEKSKYELSFQNKLAIAPDTLVSLIERSFDRSKLSKNYRVEVMQCKSQEVAYSYEMNAAVENTIVSCSGRDLPSSCYTVEVKFIKRPKAFLSKKTFWYISGFGIFILFGALGYDKIRNVPVLEHDNTIAHNKIGSYQFFPEQHKLIKEAIEINLSKKECELLSIFVQNPNQIIKRDELTKKVWEDNGVFVGRSLDTYISKLRKKLNADETIKITNVHGVGYKLEIN